MDTPQVIQQAVSAIPTPPKKLSRKVALLVAAVFIIAIGSVAYLVLSSKGQTPRLFAPKKPTVALETTYDNPFKPETQFVNPFQEYKNPFRNIF